MTCCCLSAEAIWCARGRERMQLPTSMRCLAPALCRRARPPPLQGLCELSECGGTGSADDAASPWNSKFCQQTIPVYKDASESPVNRANNCNYFHNLESKGASPKCVPCGWPGHACENECQYTIQWNSIGLPEYNVGTYRVRGDLRSVRSHVHTVMMLNSMR